MNWWMDYPWLEVLFGVVFLFGGITSLLMFVSNYPSSRFLGQLILSYLIFLGLHIFDVFDSIQFVGLVFISLSLFLYAKAFFDQKSRLKLWYFWPLLAAIVLSQFPVLNISASILAGVYLYISLRTIRKEGQSRGIVWFQNPGSRLIWFRNFMILNALFLVLLMISPSWISPELIASGILLLLVFIQYQLFKESSFLSPIPLGNKYQKSTLSPAIKASILSKLDHVMVDEKFYLRDDASLSNLASELRATTHHLSQVLNETKKISFQDLISQYRIREACRLLKDENHQQVKIENIATLVGYNSKSAFNTAFKRRMEVTPSEYRDLKDVRSYREERLSERTDPFIGKRPLSLSHVFTLKLNSTMVTNFLKVFLRNLKRNKVFTAINLFGLILGFTCCMLIYLFISDELSYDTSIPDADRIYRIAWEGDNPQTRTPHPMAQAMVNDLPDVVEAVSISPWYGPGLSRESVRVKNSETNALFEEPDFYFADSTFFDVFNIEVLEGDAEALSKPWTLVIAESMAKKYFGDSSAIGKELELNDMPIEVSAVVRDLPENTHFHFNAIIPYATLRVINPNDSWMTWADFGHFNYIKVGEGVDVAGLENSIPNWVVPYLDWSESGIERLMSGELRFELQPIQDIHLTSHLRWELESNGNILYIYILSATFIFILLIVCINYVNLTTSKSMERAKEIGVRKTLGAISSNLSLQFYLESILFCLMAMVFAFGAAIFLIEPFNQVSGKNFMFNDLFSASFLTTAFGLSIVVGILAGAYPALFLSSFKPTEVLKGKLSTSLKGVRMRSVLVTLQFMVSAILIAGSLIILRQIDFMKNKELGFDQEAVVAINIPISIEIGGIDLQNIYSIRQQIEALSGVRNTSMVSNLPGGQFNQHAIFPLENPDNRIDVSEVMVDFGFDQVLGLEVVDGRSFNSSYATDTAELSFMINEIAAQQLGLENPVGEKVVWVGNDTTYEASIIGVVKDFHYRSMHEDIQPLIMVVEPEDAGHVVIKLDGKEFGTILSEIEAIYVELNNEIPFEYQFLDENLAKLYDQEVKTLGIFSIFSTIALVLASLGLLGMALAMLNQRIKEVGMRKILGASSAQIMQMIFAQFLKLIAIALLLGLPLSFFLMQNWMNEFSYQAPFGLMPFVWSIVILLLVAAVSVSSAVMKISFSNPVEALKYE
jgi:ABC-type antimicrobial peptide transport system permease subunit/AraC-like DNA-binding protein